MSGQSDLTEQRDRPTRSDGSFGYSLTAQAFPFEFRVLKGTLIGPYVGESQDLAKAQKWKLSSGGELTEEKLWELFDANGTTVSGTVKASLG